MVFPSYHPRAGEPTYFLEKILTSIGDENFLSVNHGYEPKHHTIRAGHRWKVGDKFSPRVWSGKPYQSKQIIIAPDIEVKKVWDFEIDECDVWAIGLPNTQIKYTDEQQDAMIAKNDGLTEQDLYWWFKGAKKPFIGQIICWDDSIEY